MKKRQIKKIVKKYGDSWWKMTANTEAYISYYLNPPKKWENMKILDEFYRQHYNMNNDRYYYPFPLPEFTTLVDVEILDKYTDNEKIT